MSKIEDIEKAVEGLAPAELAQFRAWFEAFDADVFDQTISADASSGRLDRLAEQALNGHRQGRAREL
ncbi:MAG: hypothetical protein V4477_14510 [Pseudomonadota bacterium]